MRQEALLYSQLGWRVFPLASGTKDKPLVRWTKEASIEGTKIKHWWAAKPTNQPSNIGIATGSQSALVIIDIDDLDAWTHPIDTLAATTGKGRHLYYRCRVPLRGSVGTALGKGIDVRADGNYAVAPPSLHPSGALYRWENAPDGPSPALIADLPEWLLEALRGHQSQNDPLVGVGSLATADSAYGLVALDNQLDRLLCAPEGQRNHTLNRVVYEVARLVAGGYLVPSPQLLDRVRGTARCIGLHDLEIETTIRSAYAAGIKTAWTKREQTHRPAQHRPFRPRRHGPWKPQSARHR